MIEFLKPCPWCAKPLYRTRNKINPFAVCKTADCYGSKMPVVNLDDPENVSAWNRRPVASPGVVDAPQWFYPCIDCINPNHCIPRKKCRNGNITPSPPPAAGGVTPEEKHRDDATREKALEILADYDAGRPLQVMGDGWLIRMSALLSSHQAGKAEE